MFNYKQVFFFCGLFLCCSLTHGRFINLKECLAIIQRQNLSVLLNKEIVEQALQEQYSKKSNLFPKITADFSQIRQRTVVGMASPMVDNAFASELSARVSLFDLNTYNAYKAAKVGLKITKEAHEKLVESILYQTAKSYYRYAYLLKSLEVFDKNIETNQRYLDLTEQQFKVGTASKIDVVRAKSHLAQNHQQRLSQKIILDQAHNELKAFLNLNDEDTVEVDLSILDIDSNSQASILANCIHFEDRPDYREQFEKIDQSQFLLKQAKSGYWPVLSAYGTTGLASKIPFDKKEVGVWSVGVKISLPLFEGWYTQSEIAKARANIRAQTYAMENLKNTINRDYSVLKRNLEICKEQVEYSRLRVTLAQDELYQSQYLFESAIADNQELLSAQASLVKALDDAFALRYQYAICVLDIAFAQGKVQYILDIL